MNFPTCSIIICVYNKSDYVAAAVDSALAQMMPTGEGSGRPPIEVIAVDDGSTDRSLEVLASYGSKIMLIQKENGGQASAMNAGFSVSSGQIVFFLDADDVLLPDTVRRVCETWNPRLAKVHFRLQQMEANGTPIPGAFLPPYRDLRGGDLRPLLRRFGFYPSPPTTGNAFARRFLERVMPIPETVYRIASDTLLIGAAPLFGEVGVLTGIGGFWRRTDTGLSTVNLDGVRAHLRCDEHMVMLLESISSTYGGERTRYHPRWPKYLKESLVVTKFASGRRTAAMPLVQLALAYIFAVVAWPEYRFSDRARFLAWAAAMVLLPPRIAAAIPGIAGQRVRLK
jgi:glycosyltransferase involved in cell wall biosynthesis